MLHRYLLAPLAALLLLAAAPRLAHAQTGAVGIGTTAPDAAAALDIVSTSKGLLVPRLTATQRGAIAAPVPAGLLVYQTDGVQPGFWYYEATAGWKQLATGTGGDNLGNHTATQNLALGANLLTGTGGYTGSAVGIGVRADGGLDLGQNTAGNNLYVGFGAGRANTTPPGGYGTGNQYIGYQSGYSNITGSRNDFSGYQSGYYNTTGSQNTFGGASSGYANTEGHSNTFYGFYSGGSTTTGIGNTFVGSQTGISNRTGSNNTALGVNSGPVSSGFGGGVVVSNATAVGANVGLTTSNTLILGNNVSVGIGTSEPGDKLEVRDGNVLLRSSKSAYVGIRSYSGIVGTLDMGVAATDRSYSYLDHAGDAVLASNNSLLLASRHGGSVVVGTGPNIEEERLRVTSDGNVGIGTSIPAQRLEVAGSVQISGTGSGLVFPDGTTQTTAASTAPAQTLALSGQDLSLSGGNTVTLPTQQLSISGSTISLTDGGSVTVPGDNLGNHTATTNIGLNGNWLSNAPGNANGIRIDNSGNVGMGVAPTATGLQVRTAEKSSVSGSTGVFLSGGASGNPNIELRGNNGATYLDFVNGTTADYDSRILSGGTGLSFYTGNAGVQRLLIGTGGTVTLSSLTSTGPRMVTAAADGTLGIQALPTADNLGNHTATQKLDLTTFPLVGNGGTTGLTIANNGAVTTAGALTATGNLATGGTLTATGALTTASTLTAAGTTKLSALGNGSSTRMVTAAADGTLAATTLPTDAQQLSISNSTISLTNGGSVNLPTAPGDNLGNHTATQALNLGTNALVGNGGTTGMVIDRNGLVGLNVPVPTYRLDVGGNLRVNSNAVITYNLSVGTTAANVPFTVQAADGSGFLQSFYNSAGVSKYLFMVRNGGLNLSESTISPRFFMRDDANGGGIGIGTDTPGHPLTVAGGGVTGTALLGFSTYRGVDKFNFTLVSDGLSLNESGVADGRLFVKEGGNVGVGTTTPVSRLSIGVATSQANNPGQNLGELSFVGFNRATASASIQAVSKGFDDTGHLLFKTSPDGYAPAERLRITADGNVGIGTPIPNYKLEVNGTALINASGDLLLRDANVGLGWYTSTGKVFTAITGFDGPALYGYSSGLLGTKDGGNRAVLVWNKSGQVGIGTTTPAAPLQVNGVALVGGGALPNTTNATGIGWNAVTVNAGESEFYNYRGTGGGGFRFFSVGGTNAPVGGNQIAFINTAGVYSALSDRRVKTNITPLAQGLRAVLALRPVAYDFHTSRQLKDGVVTFLPDDKPVRALGFVAQDLLQVVPEAVEKPSDDRKEFYTVSYTTLVPVLTQAIQEQQAQIEELKKQNAALQSRAATAETKAAQATATLETFEARLRRLEAAGGQAQR